MNDRPLLNGRLMFGLLVLGLGVAWTLDTLGLLDASLITRWWPLLALAWGLARLTGFGVGRRPVVGAFWTVVGGLALLGTLQLVRFSVFDLWPLMFMFAGAAIAWRAWRGQPWCGQGDEEGSHINAFALLGGSSRKVVSQEFKGGEVSAVMGGATVDLRPAALAGNRARIEVFAMWGGIEIVVPQGWRVVGEVTPVLGGFEDSTAPPVATDAPVLVVRGTAIMGGVEVKHEATRSFRAGVIIGDGSRSERRSERREERRARVRVETGPVSVRVHRDDGTIEREVHVGPTGIHITRRRSPEAGGDPATPAGGNPGAPAGGERGEPIQPE